MVGNFIFARLQLLPGLLIKINISQSTGTYYKMEQEWSSALSSGGTVRNVKIDIIYGADGRPVCKRPQNSAVLN